MCRLSVLLAGLIALSGRPALAQAVAVPSSVVLQPRALTPPTLDSPAVTLSEAVRLTLLHSPAIVEAAARIEQASGVHRESRGRFDGVFRLAPALEQTQTPVLSPVRRLLAGRQAALRDAADLFPQLARQYQSLAQSLDGAVPPCPRGFLALMSRVDALSASAQATAARVGSRTYPDGGTPDAVLSALGQAAGTLCRADPDPLTPLGIWYRTLASSSAFGGAALPAAEATLAGAVRARASSGARLFDDLGLSARTTLAALGTVPDTERQRRLALEADFSRTFRSGIELGWAFAAEGTDHRYVGKPFAPASGGAGIPARFPMSANLSLAAPLGKGRGATSTSAAEVAARQGLEAARELARHVAAAETFRVVVAYVSAAAAQARIDALEQAASRQAELTTLVAQQVAAELVSTIEQARANARAAAVSRALADARAQAITARASLADAMGVDAGRSETLPVPSEAVLDARPDLDALADLLRRATDQRRDARALERLSAAAAALEAAARVDLRRRVDVQGSGGLESIYENAAFDVSSPRGFANAFTGRWTPVVRVALAVSLPFANNAAKGRLGQARARSRAQEIARADRTRSIQEGIVGALGAAQAARRALEQVSDSVRLDTDVLAGVVALFRVGEITLIDVLRTDEQAVADRLEQIRLAEAYLALVARVRYESGDLVRVRESGADAETLTFDPFLVGAR